MASPLLLNWWRMSNNLTKLSRFLALVLRHQPETIGLQLDAAGWAPVAAVVSGCNRHGQPITLEELRLIVETSDKQRFALSECGTRIRANQGHSIDVDLGYSAATPPALLFHGTASRFVTAIKAQGLQKQKRHHVHLTASREIASAVGSRYGKLCLLVVQSGQMHSDGHEFFRSTNGVWLTDHVPPQYIEFTE